MHRWGQLSRVRRALFAVTVLTTALVVAPAPARADVPVNVPADIETEPVLSSGDGADDPAIWVHPTDPARSVVIGNDKGGALEVYDMDGRRIQRIAEGFFGNVDVRHGFRLGNSTIDLVGVSRQGVRLYTINPTTRLLSNVTDGGSISSSGEGFCLYRSGVSGRFYAFHIERGGTVRQFELRDADADGLIDGQLVRSWSIGSESEGCVADDELGDFYVSEEDVGIWKYGAEPGDGTSPADRVQVDTVTAGGHLLADAEGLALVHQPNGTGYLMASAQNGTDNPGGTGDSFVTVYERQGSNRFVSAFKVVAAASADGCSMTDGIAAVAANLGPRFPFGLFVCQDHVNTLPGSSGNQNFKYVALEKLLPLVPAQPSLSVGDASVTEGDVGAEFTVSLARAGSTHVVTVDFAVAGGSAAAGADFTAVHGSLTFGPTETSKTISVPVHEDTVDEADETFVVNLANAAGAVIGDGQGVGTIVDDDGPQTVTLGALHDATIVQRSPNANAGSAATLEVDNSPVKHVMLAFDASQLAGQSITRARIRLRCVDSSNFGGDFGLTGLGWTEGSVTWSNAPPAGASAGILRTVTNGAFVEVDVTAAVRQAAAAGQDIAFRVTSTASDGADYASAEHGSLPGPQLIVDISGPAQPSLSVGDVSVVEGDVAAEFTVTLNRAGSTGLVSVDFAAVGDSAAAGADFTGVTGTLSFASGETSKTISVPVHEDTVDEADETFVVNLANAAGAVIGDGQGVGTIVDDDGPQTVTLGALHDATIVQRSPNANAGSAATLEVDNSPVKHVMLAFDASQLGGQNIASARIRLRCVDASSFGGDFRLTGLGWTEGSVTWSNAPPAGASAGILRSVTNGAFVEVDVTAAVRQAAAAGQDIAFRVTSTSNNGADYASAEHGSLPGPQLLLDLSGPA